METLIQDIRFGFRQMRRNPAFSVLAVATLALGIGAVPRLMLSLTAPPFLVANDSADYFAFVDKARAENIQTPIIPGIVTRPIVDPEVTRKINIVTVAGRRFSPAVAAYVVSSIRPRIGPSVSITSHRPEPAWRSAAGG